MKLPTDTALLCSHRGAQEYVRGMGTIEGSRCGNRARYRQVREPHGLYCGRHIRHVGAVESLPAVPPKEG